MGKRLPYFQFEPAEYFSGDITLCTYAAQGVFTHIEAIYWQRDCDLTLTKARRLIKEDLLIDELIEEGVLKLDGDTIVINFLNEQLDSIASSKKRLSEAGKKGAEAKAAIAAEKKAAIAAGKQAPLKQPLSHPSPIVKQLDKIRVDKIRVDEIREDIFKEGVVPPETIFNYKKSLLDYGFEKSIVDQYLQVRKNKKATNSEIAFNSLVKVIERCVSLDKNVILTKCVEKSWVGLEYDWLVNIGMIKKRVPFNSPI